MSPEIEKQLEQLQELIDIQADTGNWDYDPYMHGMLNGMLLAKSLLDGIDPKFKDAPKTWSSDFDVLDKFNNSGVVINEDHIISSTNKT